MLLLRRLVSFLGTRYILLIYGFRYVYQRGGAKFYVAASRRSRRLFKHCEAFTWGTSVFGPSKKALARPSVVRHELEHVRQYEAIPLFPWVYAKELDRRGYRRNRFEVLARRAERRRSALPPVE